MKRGAGSCKAVAEHSPPFSCPALSMLRRCGGDFPMSELAITGGAVTADEPDQMPNPAAVMANRAALLQNLGNIFPISEVDRNNPIKLQSWYVLALDQVRGFLKASGASADIVLGFIYLTDAIGQLKNGTVASVVQRATPGNRGS
jgi:hypothetical protein